MKLKAILIISLIIFTNLKSLENLDSKKPNLFKEINITSQKAICKKDKQNKSIINFTYIDNVLVNFSDGSLAKAEKLSIKINTASKNKTTSEKNNSQELQNLKQISLSKNVFIQRENRNINADLAEIFPSTKICKLSGNIKIEQIKKDKDFPIITKCENAHLDLVTEKITLLGDKNKPVRTIINLEGFSGLRKKKKVHTNKNI
jgi:hypothetical protein